MIAEAKDLGFRNPSDAYRLLDTDDPKTARQSLMDMANANPNMVDRPTAPVPGVGGPPLKPPKPTETELFAQLLRNGVRGGRR